MEYWIWFAAAGLLGFNVILGAGIIMVDRRHKRQKVAEFSETPETDGFLEDILAGQKEVQAVILDGNIAEFQELVHDMGTKEVYALINQTLSHTVPAVYRNEGIIDCFQNAGIRALFVGQRENGLNAAVLICEEMLQWKNDKRYKNFSIGLCYGKVSIGVVGYGKRLSVLTLSTYTGFAKFLQKMGPKYYARILAAGSYVEHIRGFGKSYNHRFLGIFFVRDTNREEMIYDIFDGDEAGVRNRKRKTKMLFESGVKLFLERDFHESRIYFIEVLKADHSDKAAREYVYLCDTYGSMSTEETELAKVYLEYF